MKRRKFIKTTGASLSVPLIFNGISLSAVAKPLYFNAMNTDSDRVLVLVQLSGGNDGLNTVIPLDQYDRLANARGNIMIPENQVITVTDEFGFHPKMNGVKSLYDDGKLGIVQSVGYPNQNRSHFRSMEIWSTGSTEEEGDKTGWLGRYFDDLFPGFPDNYPNGDQQDPFAIAMGNYVSPTCQGLAANFSVALKDLFTLGQFTEWEADVPQDSYYGQELAFLRETITDTNAYFDRISDAANAGNNMVTYPETKLGEHLKSVARLIAGGLQTKVYVVTLDGFDTHASQVAGGQPTEGRHAQLLETLSEAIHAFQQDLIMLGIEERVVGMTYSEFGRRIRSNSSFGTDHGTAAPMLLFGSCVNPQVLGQNPDIPEEVGIIDGVPMQYDFRDVYGSVLMDWFEAPLSHVQSLLGNHNFQYLPIVNGCQTISSQRESAVTAELELLTYPNPFKDGAMLEFTTAGERVRLSLFDAIGSELEVLVDKRLPAGKHQLRFDGRGLASGNYYFRLVMDAKQCVRRAVKIQ